MLIKDKCDPLHSSEIYLDVLIAHNDLVRSGNVLQHRNLVINVGKTHQGTQDGLSLDPRRLKKNKSSIFNRSSVKTAQFREEEEDTGGED